MSFGDELEYDNEIEVDLVVSWESEVSPLTVCENLGIAPKVITIKGEPHGKIPSHRLNSLRFELYPRASEFDLSRALDASLSILPASRNDLENELNFDFEYYLSVYIRSDFGAGGYLNRSVLRRLVELNLEIDLNTGSSV